MLQNLIQTMSEFGRSCFGWLSFGPEFTFTFQICRLLVTSSRWRIKASTVIQKASRVLHLCFPGLTSASSFKLCKKLQAHIPHNEMQKWLTVEPSCKELQVALSTSWNKIRHMHRYLSGVGPLVGVKTNRKGLQLPDMSETGCYEVWGGTAAAVLPKLQTRGRLSHDIQAGRRCGKRSSTPCCFFSKMMMLSARIRLFHSSHMYSGS